MTIGFKDIEKNENENNQITEPITNIESDENPVKSVVTVKFSDGRSYDYYNDMFDLKIGDQVFVSGKLAGKIGKITEIMTSFKISLKYYQKVLVKINRKIHGEFRKIRSLMVSFDSIAPEFSQVKSWFIPPKTEEDEEEIVSSSSGLTIKVIDGIECPELSQATIDRAIDLLSESKLKFLSIREEEGHSIIEGSNKNFYSIDFKYKDGVITDMFCDCFMPTACKHEAAVALFVDVLFDAIEEDFDEEYSKTNCVTAFDINEFINTIFENDGTIKV